MLQPRSRPSSLHLPRSAGLRASPPAEWQRQLRHLPLTPRAGWPLTLWRLVWSPWWLGSEMPPPPLPRQTRPATPNADPGRYVARSLDALCRRYHAGWVLLLAVRGLWLGLMLSVVWMLLSIADTVRSPSPAAVVVLVGAGCALGLLLGCFVRPDRCRLARMLDRSYGLDERLTTAVELLAAPPARGRQGLGDIQLADAANQIATLQLPGRIATLVPIRELMLLLLWSTLLLALAFAGLNDSGIPAAARAAIPAYVPVSQRLASPDDPLPATEAMPSVAEIQERSRRSNDARRNLDLLGEALGEHASTKSAADAIAAGDYPQAAEALRTAASDASQLSPEARAALADDLDTSAGQMSGSNAELAESTRQAADGLRSGGDQSETGLNGLADEVERTGQQVVPQEELAAQQAAAQGSTAGQPAGQAGASGEAGDGAQRQPGGEAAQGESGGEPGNTQDPGTGVDARAGGASNDQSGGQQQSGQESGGAQEGGAGGESQTDGQSGQGQAG
ncbi:MAG: hypothetical protein M3N47_10320, partial [Chloroflexota bacterium]|nr:hypothetical protein [Chloroflexota bacterium]